MQGSSIENREAPVLGTERLLQYAQELSMARDLDGVMGVVRRAARELTGADGATFVLRDGDHCFYADENAISPLWKGSRFPLQTCISGWAMLNQAAAVIEDIFCDPRIPVDVYRKTFVKSLAMVPIRTASPIGAIGNYWAEQHKATDDEVKLLRALAELTSVAMENVQLYEALQKKIREAEAAVGLRDEFIAVAAHELRTPLTAMLLQLQRLEESLRTGGGDGATQIASRSVGATRRFAALVDGLVDVSQLVGGRLDLQRTTFELGGLAREVAASLEATARRVGSDIELLVQTDVVGSWDRTRIERVLSGLLSNAIKYGAGKPIRMVVEQRDSTALVSVTDQGEGVSAEVAEKLFKRFGRSGSISQYGGLGVGLYLAREVLQAHGGGIHFENRENQGCTFTLELPVGAPEAIARA